jgi:hypothetical protein
LQDAQQGTWADTKKAALVSEIEKEKKIEEAADKIIIVRTWRWSCSHSQGFVHKRSTPPCSERGSPRPKSDIVPPEGMLVMGVP